MKQPAMETTEYLMNDAASELEAFLFADLALTETEASDVTAGHNSTIAPPPCLGCTWGPPVTNHNETVTADDSAGIESLADLPVEEAEQIKGGFADSPPGTGKTLTCTLLGK